MPRISVVVPARDEEVLLPSCLAALRTAAGQVAPARVETIVVANRCTDRTERIAATAGATVLREDRRSLAAVRNRGVAASAGQILVTVDADTRVAPGTLAAIARLAATGRYVGGGCLVQPDRWSAGIVVTGAVLGAVLARHRVSAAVLWTTRTAFDAVGGFDDGLPSGEDLDLAIRLRGWGRVRGRRWATLVRHRATTSTRKFDQLGDWYLVRHPRTVRDLLSGGSVTAADRFYYDAPR